MRPEENSLTSRNSVNSADRRQCVRWGLLLICCLAAGRLAFCQETSTPPRSDSESPSLPPANAIVRLDLTRVLWSVPIHCRCDQLHPDSGMRTTEPRSDFPFNRSNFAPKNVWIDGTTVILADAFGVRALNLQTGRAAWPYDEDDLGDLIRSASDEFSSPSAIRGNTLDCSDSRTFGALVGNRWIGLVDERLVCLNLSAEGRLEWAHPLSEMFSEAEIQLESLAACHAFDGVVVTMHRKTRPSIAMMAAIDSTGSVLWESVGVERSLPANHFITDGQTPAPCCVVAAEGNLIYWNLAGGPVVAVESGTGAVVWMTMLSESNESSLNRSAEADLLIASDQLVVLQAEQLAALDKQTGEVLWSVSLSSMLHSAAIRQIVGIGNGIVVVAGSQLWGIAESTGRIAWRVGSARQSAQGAGRGLCRGRSVFWPTRDELWTVDIQTGQIRQRDQLRQLTGNGGGNLTLVGETLLIAECDQLTAYRVMLTTAP